MREQPALAAQGVQWAEPAGRGHASPSYTPDSFSSKSCVGFRATSLLATSGPFSWRVRPGCAVSSSPLVLFCLKMLACRQSREREKEGLLSYQEEIRCLS